MLERLLNMLLLTLLDPPCRFFFLVVEYGVECADVAPRPQCAWILGVGGTRTLATHISPIFVVFDLEYPPHTQPLSHALDGSPASDFWLPVPVA